MKKLALLALVVVPALSQAVSFPSMPAVVKNNPKRSAGGVVALVGVAAVATAYKKGAVRLPAKPAAKK